MHKPDQANSETPPKEESNNRTFRIAAGILGGIILLSVAALAGYTLLVLPSQRGATAPAVQNALVAQALTSIAGVLSPPTATITPPPSQVPVIGRTVTYTAQIVAFPTVTITPPPSQTSVVAQATATLVSLTSTSDLAAATAGAALTQAAPSQLTLVPNSTALPGTGIGDQYGPPGLVIAGIALIGVIFLARRLRTHPARQ
jgi:hypothetical protein